MLLLRLCRPLAVRLLFLLPPLPSPTLQRVKQRAAPNVPQLPQTLQHSGGAAAAAAAAVSSVNAVSRARSGSAGAATHAAVVAEAARASRGRQMCGRGAHLRCLLLVLEDGIQRAEGPQLPHDASRLPFSVPLPLDRFSAVVVPAPALPVTAVECGVEARRASAALRPAAARAGPVRALHAACVALPQARGISSKSARSALRAAAAAAGPGLPHRCRRSSAPIRALCEQMHGAAQGRQRLRVCSVGGG